MATFDLVVVGSGGGPDETNISGYLLKSHDASWEDGVIALEGGSGLGALSRILDEKPDLFHSTNNVEDDRDSRDGKTRHYAPAEIYSFVRAFLITHAHLDHIMGLVMLAGGIGGVRKSIRGSRQTLEDLETIFRPSRIWPNLASWNREDSNFLYLYDPIEPKTGYTKVTIPGDISVNMMQLSHGHDPTPYHSSAFFIRHDPSEKEFLFFGDVEPDDLAKERLLVHVWREAATKFPHRLDTMFIECSWPSGRKDEALYGHLTPEHLIKELQNLAAEIVAFRSETGEPTRKKQKLENGNMNENVLKGMTIYVIHCKEDLDGKYDRPMRDVITKQVQDLVLASGLGAKVLSAVQGTLIGF